MNKKIVILHNDFFEKILLQQFNEGFRSLDIQITISIDLATTSVAAKRVFFLLSKCVEIINYFGNR
jgi:hypothetical protein